MVVTKNNLRNKIKKYWIENARYDWLQARHKGNIFERLFYNIRVRFILSKLKLNGNKLLDLGCGTGVCTFDFAGAGANATGMDISYWAIKKAVENKKNKYTKVNFLVGDGDFLPFKANSFDVIIWMGILQYIANPKMMINEIRRVLKKGGVVFCEVPWKYSIYNSRILRSIITGTKNPNDEPINRCMSKKEVIKLFNDGFIHKKTYNFLTIVLYSLFRKT